MRNVRAAGEIRTPVSSLAKIVSHLSPAMAAEFELAGYGGHGSPAQAAALVGAPNYPNSIKWSEENLIAVASGHLVTILVRNSFSLRSDVWLLFSLSRGCKQDFVS